MIDDVTQASLLYDFYGQLLTERKQQVMELYHEENMSLTEIAEEFRISRAAVHDSLKSAEKALREYEAKLGLISKFEKTNRLIENIDLQIDKIKSNHRDKKLFQELDEIKTMINEFSE